MSKLRGPAHERTDASEKSLVSRCMLDHVTRPFIGFASVLGFCFMVEVYVYFISTLFSEEYENIGNRD
jgi:hypothetical protein